jgi:hypothetical protein
MKETGFSGVKGRAGEFVAKTLLLGFVICLAFLDTGCAVMGRRLILPGLLQGKPQAVLPPDPSYELIALHTQDGTRIVGQFGKAEAPVDEPHRDVAHVPTVIFFYGMRQNLAAPSNQKVFRGLRAMGVNVFFPEFPGHGMSGGSPGERQCYAAADAALDYLLGRADIDHDRIIAAGRSLGAATAIDLASRRHLAGLIAVGGFTNAADMAVAAPIWTPRWLANALTANCRFDNLAKIKSVSCPILLVYGTRDTVVPPWMAERLASAATVPVTRLPVPSAHNDLWKSDYFGLNAAVRDWMQAR